MKKLNMAIGLALTTALISGMNTFLTKSAVTVVSDPVVFTFLKNAVVALLLVGILMLVTRFRELKKLTKRQWGMLVAIGIVGGSIPFILFFTGLVQTSALSASFIHKTLFVWVALLAIPIFRERLGKIHIAAFILLVGGSLALGFPSFSFSAGELMILIATILWAVENIIAKAVLKDVSSWLVAACRMTFGSIVLIGVVVWQGNFTMLGGLGVAQWGWTLMTSILLVGYVLTWYTALKYAPVTLVACLLVPATLVTNILTATFLTHTFPVRHLVSGILLSAAVALLIRYRHGIVPRRSALSQKSTVE